MLSWKNAYYTSSPQPASTLKALIRKEDKETLQETFLGLVFLSYGNENNSIKRKGEEVCYMYLRSY